MFDRKANLVAFVSVFLLGCAFAAHSQSLPTFSKAFNPSTIGPGSVTTLQFNINNTALVGARNLSFVDTLPAGVTIANAGIVSNTCRGVVDAPYGGSTITLTGGQVLASSSCLIRVDVTSSTPGVHTNISGDLTSDLGNSGPATADLTVTTDRPGFSKSFSSSSVFFGDRVRLTLTIDNTLNANEARNLTFVDNLPSGMVVASPANAAKTCNGGTVSAAAGSSVVSYTPAFFQDGTVASGASCSVSADVIVNFAGPLSNVTGELTSSVNFGPVVSSGKASALITGQLESLVFNKTFVDDPTPPGSSSTLRFSIRNVDRGRTATGIAFTDDLDAVLTGLVASGLPSAPCGAGSSLSGTSVLTMTGGELASGEACVFDVTVDVPAGAASGTYNNVTSTITADLGGSPGAGSPATDTLFVEPSPGLTMTFTDDPSGAGQTVTVQYVITNNSATSAASDISFQSEYDIVLPTANSVPANGFCGAGSTASYTPLFNPGGGSSSTPARLQVSGASLAAGGSCTFDLVLNILDDAPGGNYPHQTSNISATIDGVSYTGSAAGDTLQLVGGPSLSKSFTDDPVAAGDTVTLQFTLLHDEFAGGNASAIEFSDNLDAVISGMVATDTPLNDICGTGSSLTGTMTLTFSGGQLVPGESCDFSVTVQVPASATAGPHTNTTSSVVANVNGQPTRSSAASDDLIVAGLSMTKSFTNDPAVPGGTVNLEYTIVNDSPTSAATSIMFQDLLDDAVDNMTVIGLPLSDVCGTGSTLQATSGDRTINFQGGSLNAGESCTFDVDLQIPAATPAGSYLSRTSNFFASIDGNFIAFENARDILVIEDDFLSFDKAFVDDPVSPGDNVTLRFTISNGSGATGLSNIAFTDDLEAALAGLASVSGTLTDVCGVGSEISGTSLLSFTGGSLAAGEVCTFDVILMVSASTPLGSMGVNVTSSISADAAGNPITGSPATDKLMIDSLRLTKAFSGDPAEPGDTVSLSFTIENFGSRTAEGLSFQDDLDAMLAGTMMTSASTSDVCGTGSMVFGDSVVSLRGGVVLPGGSCTFAIDVLVPATATAGTYTNITSDLERFGEVVARPATDDLQVIDVVPPADTDGDGVLDADDECPMTVIPEAVPSRSLKPNRYALVDNDTIFDTPRNTSPTFTTTDTRGCSCEQIIDAVGLGNGHRKHGCSLGAMRNWVCDGSSAFDASGACD